MTINPISYFIITGLIVFLYPDSSLSSPTGPAPMDLRIGDRMVRPVSDTAILSPLHPPLLLGPFNTQHCPQYSQPQMQHIQVHEPHTRLLWDYTDPSTAITSWHYSEYKWHKCDII